MGVRVANRLCGEFSQGSPPTDQDFATVQFVDDSTIGASLVLGAILLVLVPLVIYFFRQGLNVDDPKPPINLTGHGSVLGDAADKLGELSKKIPKPIQYAGAGVAAIIYYGFGFLCFLVVFLIFWNGRSG